MLSNFRLAPFLSLCIQAAPTRFHRAFSPSPVTCQMAWVGRFEFRWISCSCVAPFFLLVEHHARPMGTLRTGTKGAGHIERNASRAPAPPARWASSVSQRLTPSERDRLDPILRTSVCSSIQRHWERSLRPEKSGIREIPVSSVMARQLAAYEKASNGTLQRQDGTSKQKGMGIRGSPRGRTLVREPAGFRRPFQREKVQIPASSRRATGPAHSQGQGSHGTEPHYRNGGGYFQKKPCTDDFDTAQRFKGEDSHNLSRTHRSGAQHGALLPAHDRRDAVRRMGAMVREWGRIGGGGQSCEHLCGTPEQAAELLERHRAQRIRREEFGSGCNSALVQEQALRRPSALGTRPSGCRQQGTCLLYQYVIMIIYEP